MTGERLRLDQVLVERGYFPSRARAQGAIAAGLVSIDGRAAVKPSTPVALDATLVVEGDVHDFVSRGGLKLVAALDAFGIAAEGRVCLDLGASTGGFTEVLLRAGAAKVYAVDVGAGQLHPRIRTDQRVVCLEGTHAKDLTTALVSDAVEILTCDVSFISLKKALPPAIALTAPGAALVALVKPQFEVGPDGIGKGGIVRDADTIGRQLAVNIGEWLKSDYGARLIGLIESPITGGDGNREFLIGAVLPA